MSTHKSQRTDEEIVDDLTAEAKALWVSPKKSRDDADALEAKLFARIDTYQNEAPNVGQVVRLDQRRVWGSVALMTAMAAGIFLLARPHGEDVGSARNDVVPATTSVVEVPAITPASRTNDEATSTKPAELAAVTSGGELRVNGIAAALHTAAVRDGQTAEAHGGDAIFSAPGRVEWLLEKGTEVSIVRAGTQAGPIVLALSVGAIEAQVVPAVTGEATFAIDVDGVRVGVHGTHFRVARAERGGAAVVVDLSEGVISVGAPPTPSASASKPGLLVNAPAHVEFSVKDLDGTMRVEHDPAHVRAAVDPVRLAQSSMAPEVAPSLPVSSGTSVGNLPGSAPRTPSVAPPKVLTAADQVNAAIHSCATTTLHPNGGALTVSSMLTVKVNPDGSALGAVFYPPIAPEFQSCVAKTVYATTWAEPGEHKIPIELHL